MFVIVTCTLCLKSNKQQASVDGVTGIFWNRGLVVAI